MIDKTILFSGRFDRPHLGHLITIGRLGQKYRNVIVCVLDYPEQFYPVDERCEILGDALKLLYGNYTVCQNTFNFERITKDQIISELSHYQFDVYGTGNWNCYNNMKNLGYEVIEVPRYPNYAATNDRCFQKIMKVIEEEFGKIQ